MNKYKVQVNGKEFEVSLLNKNENSLALEINNKSYSVNLTPSSQGSRDKNDNSTTQRPLSLDKEVKSPMPGLIIKILVKEGESVKANQPLLTVEAMKMENSINAPADCKVEKIHVTQGQEVTNRQLLVTLA